MGSEMGIRDRDSKAPVDDFQAEFEKLVQLAQEWRDHFAQKNMPCFIYTSDTADDLLGLNRGGRGTSKNKKNITTSNYHVYLLIVHSTMSIQHQDHSKHRPSI